MSFLCLSKRPNVEPSIKTNKYIIVGDVCSKHIYKYTNPNLSLCSCVSVCLCIVCEFPRDREEKRNTKAEKSGESERATEGARKKTGSNLGKSIRVRRHVERHARYLCAAQTAPMACYSVGASAFSTRAFCVCLSILQWQRDKLTNSRIAGKVSFAYTRNLKFKLKYCRSETKRA